MAYILMVNAGMFAELPGVSYYGIYIATAISAAIGTILIGLLANLPMAQASAMAPTRSSSTPFAWVSGLATQTPSC